MGVVNLLRERVVFLLRGKVVNMLAFSNIQITELSLCLIIPPLSSCKYPLKIYVPRTQSTFLIILIFGTLARVENIRTLFIYMLVEVPTQSLISFCLINSTCFNSSNL